MFKNIYSFKGRIGRLEYNLSWLVYLLIWSMFYIFLPPNDNMFAIIMLYLLMAILLWILYAQTAKRCHDVGKSAWWMLIPFYVAYLFFAKSMPASNNYGPNPREKVDVPNK